MVQMLDRPEVELVCSALIDFLFLQFERTLHECGKLKSISWHMVVIATPAYLGVENVVPDKEISKEKLP